MGQRQDLLETPHLVDLRVVLVLSHNLKGVTHQRSLDVFIELRKGLFDVSVRQLFVAINVERRIGIHLQQPGIIIVVN